MRAVRSTSPPRPRTRRRRDHGPVHEDDDALLAGAASRRPRHDQGGHRGSTTPAPVHLASPVDVTGKELYRVPEAMEILSLRRSVMYEQLRSGRLRSVRVGRTRLVPASAITAYVALLEQEATGAPRALGTAS
ncbi:helix-turn-helix domain-containing protein [Pseudonocardia broussonetiae]|uniref:Helix-turn-helix domain-containing protein n=1 Tax=Pseudonocardia broussonetiae TaxID=2736640 RepID=A0A6M6JS43_9PSEU|nr:helix-turn-helix domain-containing protein [Pseudonocardia broussonetiae]